MVRMTDYSHVSFVVPVAERQRKESAGKKGLTWDDMNPIVKVPARNSRTGTARGRANRLTKGQTGMLFNNVKRYRERETNATVITYNRVAQHASDSSRQAYSL